MMAQFSTDLSGYTVGDDPTVDGPAEWTQLWSSITGEVKSDATHGNYIETTHTNHGGFMALMWDTPGTAIGPENEVLVLMRRGGAQTTGAWVTASGTAGSENTWRFTLRNNNTDARISNVDNGSHSQLVLYSHGLASNAVGVWVWKRARVEDNGDGSFTLRVRVWDDGDAEPGTWTTSTTTSIDLWSSGRVGFGGWDSGAEVTRDIAFMGVGTNGDTAPSPSAAQTINLGRATETDVARALTVLNPRSYTLGRATETDVARALTIDQGSFGTPTGLTVTTVSDTQLDISWDAVTDASGYDLERDSVVILTDHATTSYSDTGLTQSTSYDYRVRAVKA